jgi:hypothetical protein
MLWLDAPQRLIDCGVLCRIDPLTQPCSNFGVIVGRSNGFEQIGFGDSEAFKQITGDAADARFGQIDRVLAGMPARQHRAQFIDRARHQHEAVELVVATARRPHA